jgi:hypothetical protein
MEVSGKFHPAAYLPLGKELPLAMATELGAGAATVNFDTSEKFNNHILANKKKPKEIVEVSSVEYLAYEQLQAVAYRGGGLGCSTPPPRNSEGPPKSCQTQPDCENC